MRKILAVVDVDFFPSEDFVVFFSFFIRTQKMLVRDKPFTGPVEALTPWEQAPNYRMAGQSVPGTWVPGTYVLPPPVRLAMQFLYTMRTNRWLLHVLRAWCRTVQVEEQQMAWRRRYFYGPFWHEFDDLMSDMETQFNEMLEELASTKALPGKEMRARMLPAIRGEFRVDVKEHDDEIIVAADLPGVEKEDVSIEVLEPKTLRIAFSRQGETKEEGEGYYVRERTYGSMDRVVKLPAEVTDEGATATFRNGVLELRLKKTAAEEKKKIPIE